MKVKTNIANIIEDKAGTVNLEFSGYHDIEGVRNFFKDSLSFFLNL